jgi:hypothetical protein
VSFSSRPNVLWDQTISHEQDFEVTNLAAILKKKNKNKKRWGYPSAKPNSSNLELSL